MKRYILKKDLPTLPVGAVVRITKKGHLAVHGRVIYRKNELRQYPQILRDWFEELPDETNWEDNAIKSELAKVLIAPVDYIEGDKKHFTWEEAWEIYGKLDNGWRLPTRHEWVMICEEFGQKDGRLDTETLMKNLRVGLNGGDWHDGEGICLAGDCGYYWSSTPVSDGTNAYRLNFNGTSGIYPSVSPNRQYGFSVRLVKDLEAKK